MEDLLILKSQAAQVFSLVQTNGFQTSDFYWDTKESFGIKGIYVSVIFHKPTNFYFTFDLLKPDATEVHSCEFSPGRDVLVEKRYPYAWNSQLIHFNEWLTYLKREIESPDLWGAISHEENLSKAAVGFEDNSGFSSDQKSLLTKNLVEIKEYLLSIGQFTQEQKEFIDLRVKYLQEASDRMGKKDWINLTLGVLTNIIIALVLEADKAREFFRFAGEILNWLLGTQKLL